MNERYHARAAATSLAENACRCVQAIGNLLELPPVKTPSTFISKRLTKKFLKHCLAQAIHKIKHEARGQDVNKALGFGSCFISISATCLVLYFRYTKHSRQCFNLYTSTVVHYQMLVTIHNYLH